MVWCYNQHDRPPLHRPLPPRGRLDPAVAHLRAGQPGALLPAPRRPSRLTQIALEIALATLLALLAILANTGKFKVLKQFTQSTRYCSPHAATMPPSSGPTSRTTAPVAPPCCCPTSRRDSARKTSDCSSSCDCGLLLLFLAMRLCCIINRNASAPQGVSSHHRPGLCPMQNKIPNQRPNCLIAAFSCPVRLQVPSKGPPGVAEVQSHRAAPGGTQGKTRPTYGRNRETANPSAQQWPGGVQ